MGIHHLSTRKYRIVSTNSRSFLEVFIPCVVGLFKSLTSGHHGSSQPHCISLIWIIQYVHFYWSWLFFRIFTFAWDIFSYLSNRSFTLLTTPLYNLYRNPLNKVEPPERAMFEYSCLLQLIGHNWITLSISSSTEERYFSSTIYGLKNISGAKNLSGPTETAYLVLLIGSTPSIYF